MNILWGCSLRIRKSAEFHEQIVDRVDDFLLSRDIVVPRRPPRHSDGVANLPACKN